jgi:hypothetical protein
MNNLNNQPFSTTFADGNLEMTTGGSGQEPSNMATIGMSTGKWYFEVYQKSGGSSPLLGIRSQQPGSIAPAAKDNPGKSADGYALYGNSGYGNLVNNNSYVSYGTLIGYTTGDIISMAVDLDNNKMYWAKNGTYLNSGNPAGNSYGHSITAVSSTSTGEYFPCFGDYAAGSYVFVVNFGQDGTFAGNVTAGGNADDNGYGNFKYDVPTGFLALCSKNLSDPAVVPSANFNTILYDDGAGAKTGVGFQPDLVWLKSRGSAYEHEWTDAVRGVTKALSCDSNLAETTDSTGLTAFGADGFTVGTDNNYDDQTGTGMVAWNWKANGSGASNTDGTINTTATSANVAAGFSISTYTGNSTAGATVGHGLSVKPDLVICKIRTPSASDWRVGTNVDSITFSNAFRLNTSAASASSDVWNYTEPTSTLVYLGNSGSANASSSTYVMYCWHSVDGYSKIGSYIPNSNVDGPFVYTGFRPAWVLVKAINGGHSWFLADSARSPNNVVGFGLLPDATSTDRTGSHFDFLSNGFKPRGGADAWFNGAFGPYLYMAFAETPFKYANAR